MAQILGGNKIKLNSGKVVQAQNGGWYDAQQFWNGTLGNPGVGNNPNQTDIYKRDVPTETIAQTNPANVAYVNAERAKAGLTPSPATGVPSGGQPAPAPQPAPQPVAQPAPQPTPAPSTGNAGTTGATAPLGAQPTINLPQLYETAYASSGIRDIESELTDKTNAYNAQVAKIKDNPYLSEATMTGRIKKLDDKFRADTANIQNSIAMRKADIETKLNLESKQFDINNAQVKQAWDQFNTLLSSGSLDNASGEDIANLTRSTGISSSMIQSAIGVSREKNKPKEKKINTQIERVDDGTNITAVVIDQDTGKTINSEIIGKSKPKEEKGATKTEIKEQEEEQNKTNLMTDIKGKITLKALVNYYSSVLSIEEIYRLYNTLSPWGQAKETLAEVKQGKFKV